MADHDSLLHGLPQSQLIEQNPELQTHDGDDNEVSATTPAGERWHKTPRHRGRQRKDPDAVSVYTPCQNIHDMKDMLRRYLAEPTHPAEHTTLEFVFSMSAAFMVYLGNYKGGVETDHLYGHLSKSAISVTDALSATLDEKEQIRKQKAVSKTIVEAVQDVDGFRYSFHNNWISKEDEASRFSYYCNDSTLNKGRAANEGAGKAHKQKRKPVYDCKGVLSIKFSVTKQNLEVHYKHVPVHPTYLERAPPPRAGSKRRRLMEVFQPEVLATIVNKPKKPMVRRKKAILIGPDGRPAIAPPHGNTDVIDPRVRESGNDNLLPLVDFLDTGGQSSEQQTRPEATHSHSRSESPRLPGETAHQSQHLRHTLQTQSTLPAPGSGISSNQLEGSTPVSKQPKLRKNNKKSVGSSTVLAGIEPAAAGPMSELEELKAKLLAAEQRIQSLETAKASSWPQPPSVPPGYPPPQAGYLYSSQPAYPYQPHLYAGQYPPSYPYAPPAPNSILAEKPPRHDRVPVTVTAVPSAAVPTPTTQIQATAAATSAPQAVEVRFPSEGQLTAQADTNPSTGLVSSQAVAVKFATQGQLTLNDMPGSAKPMGQGRGMGDMWISYEPPPKKD